MKEHKIAYSILAVASLLVITYVTTLAIFNYTKLGTEENKITSGIVSMSYTEDDTGISITNAYPISDSTGKILTKQDTAKGITNGYFDFTVSATMTGTTTINYDIYAQNVSNKDTALSGEFVKIYLTDGKNSETALSGFTGTVPTYSSFSNLEKDDTKKILYHGTLNNTHLSQNFRLRMWVASTYKDGSSTKNFKIKIGVSAVQQAS